MTGGELGFRQTVGGAIDATAQSQATATYRAKGAHYRMLHSVAVGTVWEAVRQPYRYYGRERVASIRTTLCRDAAAPV